ncbi:MAG: S8 family serine peptidase [Bdellovibrionaceae bacterium]|nr:S8 family serine peptidase [Pseudobdellovibrionaceae bacterium]
MRKLTRTFGFFALFYGITAVLLFFQNCGQRPLNTLDRVPAQSPFFAKRVHLTKATYSAKIAAGESLEDSKDNVPVSVIIDNKCALEQCAQEPADSTAVSCALVRNGMIEAMRDLNQAYSWEVRASSTEQSVETYLQRHQPDQDCIIGVSIVRAYKASQASFEDPGTAQQYHHQTLRTPEALAFFDTQNLAQVKVGVVDTGVDNTHEDLKNLPGFIDWPFNAAHCTSICNFHGTFVAGIIAAGKGNGLGGYGIARNALIRSYRVGNAKGEIETTELYNALNFAISDKVEILNLSLGGSSLVDQSIQDAIVRLIEADTLVVVAAGNSGVNIDTSPTYPASFNYDGQINVAAASPQSVDASAAGPFNVTNSPIVLDSYSNYSGSTVHIAAPGQAIYSTSPGGLYGRASGTSFATPMVVAAATLLKGYMKGKGYTNVSASLLKDLLIESGRTVSNLTGKVKDSKYLDLVGMMTTAKGFMETMSTNPVSISIMSSNTVTVGANKFVRVQIEVRGGNPTAGQIVKVYTNRAFLNESYTNLSCAIVQERQFCEFDVPFSSLFVDPEIYFALVMPSGTRIADLSVPKANLELGDREAANLDGEIIFTRAIGGYAHIEGWACLKGFADPIDIEVREGSAAAPVIRKIRTVRQARGDFFNRCTAPGIDFGFSYRVPQDALNDGRDKSYFFKAIHAATGKTLNLPVLTYQPMHNDPRAPEYASSVFISSTLSEARPQVNFTRKEMSNWVLTLEGTACYWASRKPATFTVGYEDSDLAAVFPTLHQMTSQFQNEPVAVQAEAKIKWVNYNWQVKNTGAYSGFDSSKGSSGCGGSFSDISYPCSFQDSRLPSAGVKFLSPMPAIVENPGQNMSMFLNHPIGIGFVTVTPDRDAGDGCPVPSGFSVTVDYKPWISSILFGAGYAFREDKITEAQARSVFTANQLAFFTNTAPITDFNSLRFSSRAIMPKLYFYGSGLHRLEGDLTSGISLFHNYNSFLFLSGTANSTWTPVSRPGFPSTHVWYSSPNVFASPALGAGLVEIYNTGPLALPKPNARQAFVRLAYDNASAFGELGTDLRLEFSINGSGVWYEAPMDVGYQTKVTGVITGALAADIDLPAPANSIQWRLRANGQNNLRFYVFGFMTQ